MKFFFALIVISLFQIGCVSLDKRASRPKFLSMKSDWIRTTTQSDYLGYRRLQPMKPIVWRDSVIVGNTIDGLMSFDQVNGGVIWQRKFRGGVGVGAALSSGRLFVGTGEGEFVAIDANSGNTVWSFPIRAQGIGAPIVKGDRVYFISGDHILYALDVKTGRKVWTYNRQIRSAASIFGAGQPAVQGSRVYAGFADGHFVALDRNNGGLIWDVSLKTDGRFRDVDCSPIIEAGRIYVASFDGSLFSLDLEGNVVWRNQGGASSDLLIRGSRIFYSTSDGRILSIDKSSGKVIWSKDKLRGYGTAPAFYKNMILVGETEGRLLALNPEDGKTMKGFAPGHGVSSAITISKSDRIYFGSVGANLFSLRVGWVERDQRWPWDSED